MLINGLFYADIISGKVMTVYELKHLIEKNIKDTEEYSDFLKAKMEPMLPGVGLSHLEHLYFFNLGYQFAMEKIQGLLDKLDEARPICPDCGSESCFKFSKCINKAIG